MSKDIKPLAHALSTCHEELSRKLHEEESLHKGEDLLPTPERARKIHLRRKVRDQGY